MRRGRARQALPENISSMARHVATRAHEGMRLVGVAGGGRKAGRTGRTSATATLCSPQPALPRPTCRMLFTKHRLPGLSRPRGCTRADAAPAGSKSRNSGRSDSGSGRLGAATGTVGAGTGAAAAAVGRVAGTGAALAAATERAAAALAWADATLAAPGLPPVLPAVPALRCW